MKNNNLSELDLATISLLQHMPLHYNGLVIENTNTCNAECKMCYQSAGPNGSEILGKSKLETDIILSCIREASEIDAIKSRFHLSGGEAFLYLDQCLLFFKEAQDNGYETISATTNAFWAKNKQKALQICIQLRENGVTSLEISWDYWHQEFIEAEAINNSLKACNSVGIETTLRILTNKQHSMEEAISMLDSEVIEMASIIMSSPAFPTGRAQKTLNKDDFYDSRAPLSDSCHKSLNLTINSFGNVFPCCAGFDQTQNYIVGNVRNDSLHNIVKYMNNDPLIRRLVFSGIQSFVPILEDAGYEIGNNYNNICDLCWTIFSNSEYTQIIQAYVENRKIDGLNKVIEILENNIKIEGQQKNVS